MKVTLYNGKEWAIQKGLKATVDVLLKDLATSEMDFVFVLDGYEGTGKSFGSRGLAMYCATKLREFGYPETTFTVDDIQFDTQDYVNASIKAGDPESNGRKIKINVLDEGRNALNKMRRNSKSNILFTNYLSECRAMRQVHIILAPAFHDLDRYIVFWRTAGVIHFVKKYKPVNDDVGAKLDRGEYRLYSTKNFIRACYELKGYNYPHKWEERSTWCPFEVFTDEELKLYNKKKYEATMKKYYEELIEDENKDKPKTNVGRPKKQPTLVKIED